MSTFDSPTHARAERAVHDSGEDTPRDDASRIAPARQGESVARRVVLSGRVQGVGVRPALVRLARDRHVVGSVRNTGAGVELRIAGDAADVERFVDDVRGALPAAAVLDELRTAQIPWFDAASFEVLAGDDDGKPVAVAVPLDRATCDACLSEVRDPSDRRFRHPFASCTDCGPRAAIVRELPYERDATAMAPFAECPRCAAESRDPVSRRFHAQTNCCRDCGPRLTFSSADGRSQCSGDAALRSAVAVLREGGIVAVRGVGGYQLLTDARRSESVARLRRLKHRPTRPLAVLVASLAEAARLAHLDAGDVAALTDPAGPIVLVRARGANGLAPGIAPHLDTVGLLLPTTPLHRLLAEGAGGPLVCTSGNDDGDPLVVEPREAESRLRGLCDAFLHHDRAIEQPLDDSVVRTIDGRRATLRCARGLAPLRLDLPATRPLLALGGHLKAAAAWCNGRQAVLGPHVGDLDGTAARERFVERLVSWQRLFRFRPARLACDGHPDYFTSLWAQRQGLPTTNVAHHAAHVAAGMLEHGWLERPVLGVAFDGTGWDVDGTIRGGEILAGTIGTLRRRGSLRPWRLPGGEVSAREPWRVGIALLAEAVGPAAAAEHARSLQDVPHATRIVPLAANPRVAPRTTSAGRLFDGVAHLVLGIELNDHEAAAAMRLESVADPTCGGCYPMPFDAAQGWLDWRPMLAALWADRRAHAPPAAMSARFHRALAAGIAAACAIVPDVPIVLTGGTFQNRLLTELTSGMLREAGRTVGGPGAIPCHDGGLAAGQLAIATCGAEDA